ncbi:MAG: molybdenum cofactor biosynthesis protein MoaE [Thermodesulfobacteriota bacterium]|nr:molybdenum cofactor biosynthesis protein MoaE [Thermodesulfobacteriota bacterium]
MDISKTIATMKQDPAFAENVGMVLIHNGTVRGWSRGDHSPVSRIEVVADEDKVEQIRSEIERMEGIFRVVVEAHSGVMQPGDDLLFLIVAGDIRENVKPALALLLDRIKAEAISKNEMCE